jgi:hypothetical protein
MVYEDAKLREAEHFFAQLRIGSASLGFDLSAFLTATRSVLQYVEREVRADTLGRAWYQESVTRRSVVKFLKDKRDVNIHERPVGVDMRVGVATGDVCIVGESVRVVIRNAQTGEEHVFQSVADPATPPTLPKDACPVVYEFADWAGPEDVFVLCGEYLAEIRRIVADGRSRGYLTP